MQFLLSKYVMPAAASRHIETNWRTVKVLELFLKNDNRDPPASKNRNIRLQNTLYSFIVNALTTFAVLSNNSTNVLVVKQLFF